MQGGGSRDQVFSKEAVEMVVDAGEGCEVGRDVVEVTVTVAPAGTGLAQAARDLENEFVREREERHCVSR